VIGSGGGADVMMTEHYLYTLRDENGLESGPKGQGVDGGGVVVESLFYHSSNLYLHFLSIILSQKKHSQSQTQPIQTSSNSIRTNLYFLSSILTLFRYTQFKNKLFTHFLSLGTTNAIILYLCT
jgi:hypothetical protein